MDLSDLHYFFDCCLGHWSIERTYHYLTHQQVERSHTDFEVEAITDAQRRQVLAANHYPPVDQLDQLPGFQLRFHTVSETGEEVTQALRALFIAKQQQGTLVMGDYLRDLAYEEARPIISSFSYNSQNRELIMTTPYTRVVAVDSITLINPNLRIRRILNYQRPDSDGPLDSLRLVGFGVEQKVA
jgi:hypothetical protein